MDFHANQAKAKSKTVESTLYFMLAVVGTACVLYIPIIFFPEGNNCKIIEHYFLTPTGFMWCFTISLTVIGISALKKAMQLRKWGGKLVALECGASPLETPVDEKDQMLVEIVQELSDACNVKPPTLYVIRDQPGINAFVAGTGDNDRVMAVTQGALDRLTREELKGVSAHEFSHMLNGDMILSTQLIAIVYGVSSMSTIARFLGMFGGIGRFLGYFVFLGGLFGRGCAQAIQASISRQRELLADACGVEFTGSPDGLAGALKKIAALDAGSSLSAGRASYFNHLMLSDCRGPRQGDWSVIRDIRKKVFRIMASHPPLSERIKILDPTFDGDLSELKKAMQKSDDSPAKHSSRTE
jgi:Zn-dependent protease with chaperone function